MKKLSILAIVASLTLVSFNVVNAESSNIQMVNCKEKGACENNPECNTHKRCIKKEELKKEAMEACKNSTDVKSCVKEYKAKKKAEWKAKKQETVSEINQTK